MLKLKHRLGFELCRRTSQEFIQRNCGKAEKQGEVDYLSPTEDGENAKAADSFQSKYALQLDGNGRRRP
ncbi:MAG TPA: hypothetical protein VFB06_10920 [Streptosporangiaceae bacterium]|nr:hypothetical protein [Streptosporangiaceae bacterium]